jgi:hypothetical protein
MCFATYLSFISCHWSILNSPVSHKALYYLNIVLIFKIAWKKMVQHTWKTLNTRFQPIVKSIERHIGILQKQVDLSKYQKLNREWAKISAEFKKLRDDEESRRCIEVLRWLKAANVDDDQINLTLERNESLNSGQWFIDSDQFQVWSDLDSSESARKAILWIAGIPGAGNFRITYITVTTAYQMTFREICIGIPYH